MKIDMNTAPEPTVLAVTDAGSSNGVLPAAAATARVLGARLDVLEIGNDGDRWLTRALEVLNRPEVELAVTAVSVEACGHGWQLLQRSAKPIIAVPDGVEVAHDAQLSRVLVPLDGTAESATAITATAMMFAKAGLELVVLHVFDESSAPRFWDQPAHARRCWEDEFRTRFQMAADFRLSVRNGVAGEHIADVCAEERADLIAMGWAQHSDPRRARTVRTAIRTAPVPVLLVPRTGQEET